MIDGGLRPGGTFSVSPGRKLFRVRGFHSFGSFMKGGKRAAAERGDVFCE